MIYLDNCAACHRPDGTGYERVFPRLAGNPVAEADNPQTPLARYSAVWKRARSGVIGSLSGSILDADPGSRLNAD